MNSRETIKAIEDSGAFDVPERHLTHNSPISLSALITRAILHWAIENRVPMSDEQVTAAAEAACKAVHASGPKAAIAATPEAAFGTSTLQEASSARVLDLCLERQDPSVSTEHRCKHDMNT